MFTDSLEEVISFLQSTPKELNIVVMPDFFLDRLISLDCDLKTFSERLEQIAARKGGSIDGIEQSELRGGNAINTASALAALDVNVTPIVRTDKLGQQLIRHYLNTQRVNLSNIKTVAKSSITSAIEFRTKNGKVNVMLRDVGSLEDFGPNNLDEKDFEAVENADFVCVFNWAGTRHFGTELANTVFHHAKTKGKGKTYYDTADPTPNKEKIPTLVKTVLKSKHIDVLSVNENEAICYAYQLGNKAAKVERNLRFDDLAMKSARILASHLSARIDLHTTGFSATFTRKGETVMPAFEVPVLRVTGAGDAWNAGNILGDAHELSDSGRLALANAVAAYYISNKNGQHPTRKQLVKFCEKFQKQKT